MGEKHLTTARLRAVHAKKKAYEATERIEWLPAVARHTDRAVLVGGACASSSPSVAQLPSHDELLVPYYRHSKFSPYTQPSPVLINFCLDLPANALEPYLARWLYRLTVPKAVASIDNL